MIHKSSPINQLILAKISKSSVKNFDPIKLKLLIKSLPTKVQILPYTS